MTDEQVDLVHKITLRYMKQLETDADPEEVEVVRWAIHADLFEDDRLEDVSAVDLTDESDYCISIGGWRL